MHVEGDLLGELRGLDIAAGHVLALRLRPQLVHGFLAGAGDGLVGRDDDALDGRRVVQRLQHHDELRRRAVRVGDDVLLGVAGHRVGIHLRHDQRHVAVVAPARRVVDDDAALGADAGRPFLRHGRARRHQAEVGLGEIELLQILALERLVAERHLDAERPARGDGEHLVHRKFALGEHVQHFAAHVARGADNGDPIAHSSDPISQDPAALAAYAAHLRKVAAARKG